MVTKEAIFQEKLKDPDYFNFFQTVTNQNEEVLTYDEWKVVASRLWPNGSEEILKDYYKSATGVRGIKTTDE